MRKRRASLYLCQRINVLWPKIVQTSSLHDEVDTRRKWVIAGDERLNWLLLAFMLFCEYREDRSDI